MFQLYFRIILRDTKNQFHIRIIYISMIPINWFSNNSKYRTKSHVNLKAANVFKYRDRALILEISVARKI